MQPEPSKLRIVDKIDKPDISRRSNGLVQLALLRDGILWAVKLTSGDIGRRGDVDEVSLLVIGLGVIVSVTISVSGEDEEDVLMNEVKFARSTSFVLFALRKGNDPFTNKRRSDSRVRNVERQKTSEAGSGFVTSSVLDSCGLKEGVEGVPSVVRSQTLETYISWRLRGTVMIKNTWKIP